MDDDDDDDAKDDLRGTLWREIKFVVLYKCRKGSDEEKSNRKMWRYRMKQQMSYE